MSDERPIRPDIEEALLSLRESEQNTDREISFGMTRGHAEALGTIFDVGEFSSDYLGIINQRYQTVSDISDRIKSELAKKTQTDVIALKLSIGEFWQVQDFFKNDGAIVRVSTGGVLNGQRIEDVKEQFAVAFLDGYFR